MKLVEVKAENLCRLEFVDDRGVRYTVMADRAAELFTLIKTHVQQTNPEMNVYVTYPYAMLQE